MFSESNLGGEEGDNKFSVCKERGSAQDLGFSGC